MKINQTTTTLRSLNLKSNKDTYILAVAISLILASALLAVYAVALTPPQEGYVSMYLLDSQKQASAYPEQLPTNESALVYLNVENHMGNTTTYQIHIKTAQNSNYTLPLDIQPTQTFSLTLQDGETWQETATISFNQAGTYDALFELWMQNPKSSTYEFTGKYCSLSIQVE
ncbi:MAG: DUF1616 domain-containing protein [Candidatus Bathyarchaeota archaeon]|nr:DUF1616 domain-containing protein [Candidatus Bathyarchaeota archaeon]